MFTVVQCVQCLYIEVHRGVYNINLPDLPEGRFLIVDSWFGGRYSFGLVHNTIHFDRVCAISKSIAIIIIITKIVSIT